MGESKAEKCLGLDKKQNGETRLTQVGTGELTSDSEQRWCVGDMIRKGFQCPHAL